MKFGKSYMETLASPSFPQEWREGAIEYKHLKKLINGVVAELESLGLGAEVLRDLMVPPETSDSDADEEDAAGPSTKLSMSWQQKRSRQASGSGSADSSADEAVSSSLEPRVAHLRVSSHDSDAVSPLSKSVPLPTLNEEEEAKRASAEGEPKKSGLQDADDDCEECVADATRPSFAFTTPAARIAHHHHNHKDSPAALWVSSIATRERRRSSRKSGGSSDPVSRSGSASGNHSSPRHSDAAVAVDSDDAEGPDVQVLRPKFPAVQSQSEASADESDAQGLHPFRGIGKKDLEAMRRRASEVGLNAHGDREGRPSNLTAPVGKSRASMPASPSDLDDGRHDWGGHAWRERAGSAWKEGDAKAKDSAAKPAPTAWKLPQSNRRGRWVKGKGGRRARAEYELGGTQEHPIPRIRLFVESPINSGDEAGDEDGVESDSDAESVGHISDIPDSPASATDTVRAVPTGLTLPAASLGGVPDPPMVFDKPTLASAPRLEVPAGNSHSRSGSDDDRTDDSEPSSRRMRLREIVIPLTADTEFLDTLTSALSNLSTLQEAQRDSFVASTESLAGAVARVASPYATKSDLYVWREIFSLYIEMQIFESEREKDRGELSVDESEARLRRFAEELAKRGWTADSAQANLASADGKGKGFAARLRRNKDGNSAVAGSLPLKDQRSVAALEDFLRLNLALLDVKKFQRVNVEAARKILKKHDKRTALTASSDLRAFMAQQESARLRTAAGLSGFVVAPEALGSGALVPSGASAHPSLAALLPTATTGLLSESLPHILLSLLTTTLLPILPSIDDYSCAICTGVAWRPIRLDCTHLFCIRCLVKLQKKGKVDCPLCRSKGVVGSADGRNIDNATTKFMQTWFPQEVAEKNSENESERRKEEMAELGLRVDGEKCIIC